MLKYCESVSFFWETKTFFSPNIAAFKLTKRAVMIAASDAVVAAFVETLLAICFSAVSNDVVNSPMAVA